MGITTIYRYIEQARWEIRCVLRNAFAALLAGTIVLPRVGYSGTLERGTLSGVRLLGNKHA